MVHPEELGLGVPIMLDRNGKASDTKASQLGSTWAVGVATIASR